jgi:hypothetical protein
LTEGLYISGPDSVKAWARSITGAPATLSAARGRPTDLLGVSPG